MNLNTRDIEDLVKESTKWEMIYLFLMMFETYTKSSKSRVFMGMLSILTIMP